jgi:hypothetical protein
VGGTTTCTRPCTKHLGEISLTIAARIPMHVMRAMQRVNVPEGIAAIRAGARDLAAEENHAQIGSVKLASVCEPQ